ncbi:MAG: phage holin family protein [Patescibacteria group bacterium]
MLRRFLFHLLANAIAFLLADLVLIGVDFSNNLWVVLVAVLVFGFVNTFIKPIVTILSLPAIIFSLGIFYLVVNGLMLWLVSALVPGFAISGLWTAVAMGLIVSLVNWILHWMIEEDDRALTK